MSSAPRLCGARPMQYRILKQKGAESTARNGSADLPNETGRHSPELEEITRDEQNKGQRNGKHREQLDHSPRMGTTTLEPTAHGLSTLCLACDSRYRSPLPPSLGASPTGAIRFGGLERVCGPDASLLRVSTHRPATDDQRSCAERAPRKIPTGNRAAPGSVDHTREMATKRNARTLFRRA